MATSIFVCYRRADTGKVAGRLYDRLVLKFDREKVFFDVDPDQLGSDYRQVVVRHLDEAEVLVVLIGPLFAGPLAEGGRRIDDEDDLVRCELARALRRDIHIVPLLVDGASMPRWEDLPSDIADVVYRPAIELGDDRFSLDYSALESHLAGLVTDGQAMAEGADDEAKPARSGERLATRRNESRRSVSPLFVLLCIASAAAGAFAFWPDMEAGAADDQTVKTALLETATIHGEFCKLGSSDTALDEAAALTDQERLRISGANALENLECEIAALASFDERLAYCTDVIHLVEGSPAGLPGATESERRTVVDVASGDLATGAAELIVGTAAADTIEGLGGHDRICGFGGDDVITAGDGNDIVIAGSGDDRVNIDEAWLLVGGRGDDVVVGGAGDDEMAGGEGDDVIIGGLGDDKLWGGRIPSEPDDKPDGADDSNILMGGNGEDRVYGNPGRDFLFGGEDIDHLYGGFGNDFLDGGAGDDHLQGHDGNDQLFGSDGDDRLFAGKENERGDPDDKLSGGPGNDTCVGVAVVGCEG